MNMNHASQSKKTLIINILDILKKYTDENHKLSAKDICEKLQREYYQTVDRKAIKRNLVDLIDAGYNIEYTEIVRNNKNGKNEFINTDWRLIKDFTDAELRLLIDTLLYAKHIPKSQRKMLIGKLAGLSSTYFKAKIKHVYSVPENTPTNKELFYNIDLLDEAITIKKRVTFQYIDYDIDKQPKPRKTKSGIAIDYKVNPYQMVIANGRYYLICVTDKYEHVSHYRIDRIANINITNENVTPMKDIPELKNGLNLPKHMADHIYMYSGESVRAKFIAKRHIIFDILDWFGTDVILSEKSDDEIYVSVNVNQQAIFYWSMQYSENVEILEPIELRDRIKNAAYKLVDKYSIGIP